MSGQLKGGLPMVVRVGEELVEKVGVRSSRMNLSIMLVSAPKPGRPEAAMLGYIGWLIRPTIVNDLLNKRSMESG